MLVWGRVGATYSQLAMAVLMEVECALTLPGRGFWSLEFGGFGGLGYSAWQRFREFGVWGFRGSRVLWGSYIQCASFWVPSHKDGTLLGQGDSGFGQQILVRSRPAPFLPFHFHSLFDFTLYYWGNIPESQISAASQFTCFHFLFSRAHALVRVLRSTESSSSADEIFRIPWV